METTARRNRVINSNWDISVGAGELWSKRYSRVIFDGTGAPYAVLGSTSVPSAQGEIPWQNTLQYSKEERERKQDNASIIMPAGNKYPS